MNLIITGTPGSGKTTLAAKIARHYGLKLWNEKDFALKNSTGFFNEENELEIPIKEFEKKANKYLKKHKKILIEGHTLCEMKLAVDWVILLKIDPDVLEMRLENRGYSSQKVMDNVFCEGIEYCRKKAESNYSHKKIIVVKSAKTSEETFQNLLNKMKNQGID